MKKIRILRQIMKNTGANKIWTAFVPFFLLSALFIWLWDPAITSYPDALWYCYAVVTTIGFGDLTVRSLLARVLSVLLSAYAMMVFALITGVIVNYYNQLVSLRQKDSLAAVADRLEQLPELSKEELAELSETIRKMRSRVSK